MWWPWVSSRSRGPRPCDFLCRVKESGLGFVSPRGTMPRGFVSRVENYIGLTLGREEPGNVQSPTPSYLALNALSGFKKLWHRLIYLEPITPFLYGIIHMWKSTTPRPCNDSMYGLDFPLGREESGGLYTRILHPWFVNKRLIDIAV